MAVLIQPSNWLPCLGPILGGQWHPTQGEGRHNVQKVVPDPLLSCCDHRGGETIGSHREDITQIIPVPKA